MSLKFNEFVPHAPDHPGPTARVNHASDACQGSSRSLSVWRNEDGSIGAKCYRCGEGGKAESGKPSIFKSEFKRLSKQVRYEVPEDITYDWGQMDVRMTAYLSKHHFQSDATGQWNIGWSKRMNRMILPASNIMMADPGWQAKSFTEDPRYLTVTRFPQLMYTHIPHAGTDTVIITEDYLSAIRASKVLSSFALLGTKVTESGLKELLQYNKFIIWLDNDNQQVKQAQLKLQNTLSMYGQAWIVKDAYEPKELKASQMRQKLTDMRRLGVG